MFGQFSLMAQAVGAPRLTEVRGDGLKHRSEQGTFNDGSHIGHSWCFLVPATIPLGAEDNDTLSLVGVPQWAMLMVGQALPYLLLVSMVTWKSL